MQRMGALKVLKDPRVGGGLLKLRPKAGGRGEGWGACLRSADLQLLRRQDPWVLLHPASSPRERGL